MTLDASVLREFWADDRAEARDDVIAACAALARGDLGRARELLPRLERGSPEARAVDYLIWFLDNCWRPGQISVVPSLSMPAMPERARDSDSLLLTWVEEVLTTSLSLRSLASDLLRDGEHHDGTWLNAVLLAPAMGWYRAAEQAGDDVALVHASLLIAEISRRVGRTGVAAQALDNARIRCGHAGAAAIGAYQLAVGDGLVAPLQSPETLGYDLGDRTAGRVVGDAAQRSTASDFFRAARATFEQARLPRGVAAADLRVAWLARLNDQPDEAASLLRDAADRFGRAGDGAGRALALIHLVLAELQAGRLSFSRPGPVDDIAGWATGSGSRGFATGCAAIVHAEAVRLGNGHRVEEALAAFDFARRLQRAVGDVEGEQLLIGHLSELYRHLNSRGATIATAEEAIAAVMAECGGFLDSAEMAPTTWVSVVKLLATLCDQLFAEKDPDAIDELRQRLVAMLARTPGGPRPLRFAEDDPLVRQQAVRQRLAKLQSTSVADGGEWAATQAAHVELGVSTLQDMVADTEVMGHRARAERAAARGDVSEADREFAAALAAAEPFSETHCLAILALWGRKDELVRRTRAFLSREPDIDPEIAATLWLNAEQYAEAGKVLAANRPRVEPRRTWTAQVLRARVALGAGQVAEAATFAADAITEFEKWFADVPNDSFRVAVANDGDVRRAYQVAAAAALAQGKDAAAFDAADRSRSLALGSMIAETTLAGGDDLAALPALRRWRQARAEWNGAFDRRREAWRKLNPTVHTDTARRLAAAQIRLDDASGEVERVAPALVRRRAEPLRVATTEMISPHLGPDTLVLSYQLGDDELLSWALTAETCRGLRQELDSVAFAGTIHRLHNAWATGRGGAVTEDSLALSNALLGPVSRLLDNYARVLVIPSGAMHLLPFHALPFRGGSVGDDRAVSQLPAASLIPAVTGRPRPLLDAHPLVVGDPRTDVSRRLDRLPGARVEAITVARVFGTSALTDEAAGEQAVRTGFAGRRPIVHLATHGVFEEGAPDLSALALAGQDELTVAELLGLGLDADVAVLSACHSGRGATTLAGDVVGLARGLLAAGARHSVVALWPVDDLVGCLVMVMFAELLAAGETVAAALSTAQRTVRDMSSEDRENRYARLAVEAELPAAAGGRRTSRELAPLERDRSDSRHPMWWAPFIHIGH